MRAAKRSTFYLEPKVARLLRREATRTERTMSELVNETLKRSFDEDASDLALARSRAHETAIPFTQVVRKLKRSGRL